ncbi:MAG TPA: hypothetical protein VIY90_03395 [Steroidobacteraceae bacterium]
MSRSGGLDRIRHCRHIGTTLGLFIGFDHGVAPVGSDQTSFGDGTSTNRSSEFSSDGQSGGLGALSGTFGDRVNERLLRAKQWA